jgi:hypothetical protein
MLLLVPAFDFCMAGCLTGIAAFVWLGVICFCTGAGTSSWMSLAAHSPETHTSKIRTATEMTLLISMFPPLFITARE